MASNPGAYVGAVGIGVSDLKRSGDFYERVLGMKVLQTFKLPHMDEIVLAYEGRGSAIVLMHWTDGSPRNYADLPIKIVLYVPDPVAAADAIRAEGLEIVREPTPIPSLAGGWTGGVYDENGNILPGWDSRSLRHPQIPAPPGYKGFEETRGE